MKKFLIIICTIFAMCGGSSYACESNEIDILSDGTQCETTKFTITTIELEPDTEFKFYMSAMGTFYVDWGDGTVDTIARTDTNSARYNHTYTTGGSKTIRFGGVATGYTSSDYYATISFSGESASGKLIAAIDGSIGQMFPTLGSNANQQPAFRSSFTFTQITSIPENFFSGITGCRQFMFYATFEQSRAIKSIPAGLFSGVSGGAGYMFAWTFNACFLIKSIPDNLFNGITKTAEYMFYRTFSYSGLGGYIPKNLFKTIEGQEYKTSMMENTFYSTALATTCPIGTSQYITGYEEYWGGKVACEPHTHICDTGTYFPTTTDGCVECPENNYCPGGTYTYNGTNLGITRCPTGLFAPAGMWEAAQCGRILHVGDGFVYLRATKKTSPSLHLDLNHDGVADYFGNMTTFDVPMSRETSRKLKVRYNNTTYSIYDDSVDLSLYEN